MDFVDSATLYLLVGEFAVGVAVVHVVEEKVEVLHFVYGTHEDHDFGVFGELQVGDDQRNPLLLGHQHVLLLQVFGDVDLLLHEIAFFLFHFVLPSLFLETNVLGVLHAQVFDERLNFLVEMGGNKYLLDVVIGQFLANHF